MSRTIVLAVLAVLLTSCTAVPRYHRFENGHEPFYHNGGFADEEIRPGVYIVEAYGMGMYSNPSNDLIAVTLRRAKELCPQGYRDDTRIIPSHQAHFELFRCNLRFCYQAPLAQSVVTCDVQKKAT